ncbi:MAG: hypothetical protein AB1778_08700 [Candidatus Bipolaricaulota bacterium]
MFAEVLGVIPAPLWLSILAYAASVGGLFIGLIGVALYTGERRRRG